MAANGITHILKSSMAEYNLFTQTVHLHTVEMDAMLRLQAAMRDPQNQGFELVQGTKGILRPMVHELRHWVDMNCSIRGMKASWHIFNLIKDPTPDNPSIVQLKRDIGLKFFIMKADAGIPFPWRHAVKISKPIFAENIEHFSVCFYKGDDVYGKNHLFKSPIYLGSMLECAAYFQELIDAAPNMRRAGTWALDQHIFARDEKAFVYDSTLAEYHCLAHAFAGAVNEPDMLATYEFCSSLCFWLLNMPNDMLKASVAEACEWNRQRTQNDYLADYAKNWPYEAIIVAALNKLRTLPLEVRGTLRQELVYELFDCWKGFKADYFEKSHEGFLAQVAHTSEVAPEYFESAKAALIENNKKILERKTLTPSIYNLKFPPLYCGDFNVNGDKAFDGLEAHFSALDQVLMATLIKIEAP
ncbi:hypothetical protein IYR97_08000 [Pseudomonas fulva]|uniref:Uncharacterized protein n=1 Tax=Pseudomonas fulva TaxID=47880 RepID=A0A7S9QA54_9PSED|nr:hypothetical protein [Pseudomonas fulva]QPH45546.1 hypothetical protein IYR97_08000 [Pseudomonas fulva]QPH50631.1 hypothetical protein IZU98_08015 [Pseudomonas fulva]